MKLLTSLLFTLLTIFSLSFAKGQSDKSPTTFVRASIFVPGVSVEREITRNFSVIGGIGTGYYIKRKNYYPVNFYSEGGLKPAWIEYETPVLRLNYPAKLEVVQPEDETLVTKGKNIHKLIPYADLEGRYYLTLDRREKLGKYTSNKSANYMSVYAAYYIDGLQLYRINYGIQRNKNRLWLDWNLGFSYSIGELHSGLFVIGLLKLGMKLN